MFRIMIALVLTLIITTGAEARQRHKGGLHPECNVTMPCVAPYASTPDQARLTRGRYVAREVGFGGPVTKRAVRAPKPRPGVSHAAPSPPIARIVSGIIAPLAAKVVEIQSACGSKVISAVRHTYVAGTRRISQHANGTAVDMAGNPSCIYSLLRGWAGGYSTDYARVKHVHISYGGREHGIRFAHGGHKKRYARQHAKQRYARAIW